MFSARIPALIVGVAAAVLFAVGCGSSGTDNATTSSISKAEFIKAADAACKKGSEQIQADYTAFAKEKEDNPNPSQAEFEELVAKVVAPNVSREVDEIRALGAPSGDESKVDAMLAATEKGLEKAKENPEAVLSSTENLFEEADRLKRDYGLKVCGSGP